ncbi:AraC family transcriptional regulator [Xanthomonas campestris pv. raphani]|uniref:AraC family transcriptional regulator n=1 Tax=Xanthomonas campestris TaxID=339 RepID=UPI002B22B762|nr:AraC family transcriptional regulator [Xanthomonas campestris]MEA9884856.1 AraC family transcriptional regulator [Xanthomonas campestris pv. raphani]MEB2182848.1 AraC family transcriptional regulator [Xanthomonas campestris pv. campestris]
MTPMDLNLPALEMQTLFDALPDVVFFIKDGEGRYTHCNLTLVRRLGRKLRSEIIGRSPLEVFPLPLGGSYMMQDRRVLCGELIDNQLEVHLYPNRLPGWCLTFKRPLCEGDEVIGVVGISRDLGQPDSRHSAYERLSQVIDHMQANFGDNLRVQALADLAGLSVAQLERHFRRVFQVTPQQLLTKLRIESAMRLLYGDDSIASIGQRCGFADQSAFARQFKATVGMTPRDYRALKGQL